MIAFLTWYVLLTLVGLLALPVAYRIFRGLPDRGYALARPFGMLIWGYVFWLLASLQVIQNDTGGEVFALLVLAGWGVWSLKKIGLEEFKIWVIRRRGVISAGELLFLIFFAFWALIRSASPAIVGTEKPMELAFINAILHSPTFPPHDPWLSGYAISYYYFGYVMVAMLARLSGVAGSVAFNLASALWFALTALAAYGVLYNLIAFTNRDQKRPSLLWAWLAPFFVLIVSNLEGFLEMLHARGIFWRKVADGSWQSTFWKWLDVQELVSPPTEPFSWVPERIAGFWWWRASRILQDYDLAKNSKEIIDEFPFFSYLLADLHPHVLAMPFALLAIGMAMNFYYLHLRQGLSKVNLVGGVRRWFANQEVDWGEVHLARWMRTSDFWITAIALGGLAFLNTWDFPIYIALFCSVYVFLLFKQTGWKNRRIVDFLEMFFALALAGVILYFPFYIGFRSQAGGIIPSLIFFTRGVHFWLMFAPLLLPIFVWLVWILLCGGEVRSILRTGLKFASISIFGLWGLSFLLGWIAANLANWGSLLLLSAGDGTPLARFAELMLLTGNLYLSVQGATSASLLVGMAFARRMANP
jgi:YYY domain-containing protein